ncbi:hypothetical protein EDB92DRAFT_1938543 [Lactarius akahatsu]|uniref:Uncharacterized protein n=1 Tax=Lactarius akahatsu TaxID=416441 RepID=A0AAD4L594_9AGAM|nr:hypothetical protein EDB92DRAFT_1938543 [Lactarius akahatsu]
MLFSDASDSADTTQPATVDAAEATAESDCEDTADPDNTIEADLLESLAQDFNCCATVATNHGPPASSGQPQSVRSPSPDPGPPPSVQSEHSNSDGQPQLIVNTFPHGSPGAPIPDSSHELFGSSIWAPFRSQCDWEVAHWAKTWGPTTSALADLLVIPSKVANNLGLSYCTPKELNDIIDKELPGCPPFKCQDLTIAGDTHQVYFRDTLQCIRSLYGNPEFARDLAFAPERHYVDHRRACHVYSEMHTGDWWWAVQMSLEAHRPGATVIPVIISSDKTQLTLFRGKTAYPVYLTIGNIPKDTHQKPSHRAQILVGYLPTTWLEMINNKAARQRALGNVFHLCMRNILAPIASYGETGIPMMSGDGVWRRCHPIFAVFVGDYPEQGLVTCTYFGQCLKCTVHRNNLGDYSTSPPRNYDEALESFRLADGDVLPFHAACHEARLKPTFHPFWEALPLTDIFVSITPNILHQMLQGVMKHLIAWLTSAFGAVKIDVRCRSLPPNHHITTFVQGISTLSQVSGLEHKQMCKILLGLVLNLPLPSGEAPSRIIKTEVFIDLGVREHLNIPKVHSMMHYKSSIILFGTMDNYNTEQTERLHIDLAKDAYRATNHKDEYPQMTTWLERHEKIQQHGTFVTWRQQAQQETVQDLKPNGPPKPVPHTIQMTRHPSQKADALADFIAWINHPQASATALRALAEDTLLPFRSVPVYHKIKFQRDARGRVIPSRFDMVIVHGNAQVGPRIAQVRVIFQLPSKVIHQVFLSPDIALPTHLAYVEWFSPIPTTPNSNDLYKVSRLTQNGWHLASVIPVDSLFSSVHLLPRFGPETSEWNTFSVLELCRSFYVNPFSNRDVPASW